MKVFISWSGDRSKAVAEALCDWIPRVIQSAEPWMSSDVEKGVRWAEDIGKRLDEMDFGIICLTPENLEEPWILFEAGALSKKFDKARVCTYLYQLKSSEVKGPLVMFQDTKAADKEDTKKLLESINAASEQSLKDAMLNAAFDKWWPDLEKQLRDIPHQEKPHQEKQRPGRKEIEILEEILDLVREQARQHVTPSVLFGSSHGETLDLKNLVGRSFPLTSGDEIPDIKTQFPSAYASSDEEDKGEK